MVSTMLAFYLETITRKGMPLLIHHAYSYKILIFDQLVNESFAVFNGNIYNVSSRLK